MSAMQRHADGAWYGPPMSDLRPSGDLWNIFEKHVRRAPETLWGVQYDGQLTTRSSRELHVEARKLAAAFHRLGCRPGDAIVAQLPNCREGAVSFLAAMALGLVYVPVVHIYGPAELAYIIGNSRARLLIVPEKWHNIDFAGRLDQLPKLEGLQHIVMVGSTGSRRPDVHAWDSLVATANEAGLASLQEADPGSRCLIVYTSGTTAMPKGAMHSHQSLSAEAFQNHDYLQHIDNKAVFVGAPAGHIGPITMMARQCVFDIAGVYLDRWEAGVAADLIEQFRAGWTVGVPFHLNTLLPFAAAGRIPTLEMYVIGGTAVPPALVEEADKAGIRACRSYGSTEHPTIAQCFKTHTLLQRSRTDGPLGSGCSVRLVDDDDRDAPAGQPGEILSRGPDQFLGYFDTALNADAFTRDGWFRTGDIGVIDAGGFLTVVDRKKDILIRGGENISAKEVEDILAHHDAVLEAAVIGWPDATYGERVGAFVRLRPGSMLDLDAVQRHFAVKGVAKQKFPERLVIVEDFPRNPSGKILKTELRVRARAMI